MSDDWREPIPKLLRAHRERAHDLSGVGYVCPSICEIAADEIERLRSALAPAREEGRREGIEEAAAYLESQSAKSSVPELTAYRTWAHEVRKLKVRSKDQA